MNKIFSISFIALLSFSNVANSVHLKHHHVPVLGLVFTAATFFRDVTKNAQSIHEMAAKRGEMPDLALKQPFEHDLSKRYARIGELNGEIAEYGSRVLTQEEAELLASLEEKLEALIELGSKAALAEGSEKDFSLNQQGSNARPEPTGQSHTVPGMNVFGGGAGGSQSSFKVTSHNEDGSLWIDPHSEPSQMPHPVPRATATTDAQSIAQRQIQIAIGFVTKGYRNYRGEVPLCMRQPGNPKHPIPPDPTLPWDKNAFIEAITAWRQALHQWDKPLRDHFVWRHGQTLGSLGLVGFNLDLDKQYANEELAWAKAILQQADPEEDTSSDGNPASR